MSWDGWIVSDYAEARTKMVDGQLLTNKVTDHDVVEAFLEVPRENFASEMLRGTAYIDEDLPLGKGRYLIEPMVLALRLLQIAAVTTEDTVLDIGAGTGYATALLLRLAKSVVALELYGDTRDARKRTGRRCRQCNGGPRRSRRRLQGARAL